MQERNDIFNGSVKATFKVPERYFEGLKARLDTIPVMNRTISPMQRMTPYLALAACFLAILLVGNVIIGNTVEKSAESDLYNEFVYASLLQVNEYLHSEADDAQDTISDEDVVNYLIDSGTSTELIEYAGLLAQK